MNRWLKASGLILASIVANSAASAQIGGDDALYVAPPGATTRWFSFENPTGGKALGGRENKGAKGHPFDEIPAGQSVVLAKAEGTGVIRRIWLTIDDRSPEMLRALRLKMYWDNATIPAVSVPLGDFFAAGLGQMVPMDTALLASPEGRSFVSYIPMPFRRNARIVLENTSRHDLKHLYYDVDMTGGDALPEDSLYFHAYWHHMPRTALGEPFEILPRVEGRGRFLGMSVAVVTNPAYRDSWWGEGEVKMFLDGDRASPSLVGTGTEDYIGTAWGQGAFINRYEGAPVADSEHGRWSFYRFHVPDPVYFRRDARVVWQQIGGAPRDKFLALQRSGAPMRAVTFDSGSRKSFHKLLDEPDRPPISDPATSDGGVNFFRQDDVAAVAYLYLDRP